MTIKFELTHEYIELIKLLKATGLCESGGVAQMVVVEGLVKVDGSVEFRKRCKIRKGQSVDFDGQTIKVE